MHQNVMQKINSLCSNVKVTARAYIIKIWLFLLYLLNCWSVCNQTWFDNIFSVCPIVSTQYLLNCSTILFIFLFFYFIQLINLFIFCNTKLGMVVYYDEAMCHAEKMALYLQCQG